MEPLSPLSYDPQETNPNDRILRIIDFLDAPGVRTGLDTQEAGQHFYEAFILPKYGEAEVDNAALIIDLDNVEAIPTPFLHGSFGRLAYEHDLGDLRKRLRIKCDEEPGIVFDIEDQFRSAEVKKKRELPFDAELPEG